jgi:hypothetical protein
MADDSSSLLRALARIDVLRHAAANAAPAISELVAVGLALEQCQQQLEQAGNWCTGLRLHVG